MNFLQKFKKIKKKVKKSKNNTRQLLSTIH